MKSSTVLFGLVAALGLLQPASAKIERVVTKQFSVQPGGVLTVDANAGAIRLTSSESTNVEIEVQQRIDADDEQEADELLKRLALSIEQHAANVDVKARLERGSSGWRFWRSPIELTFVVKVPRPYHATLKTSGGSIRVDSLSGNLDAKTAGGSLRLGAIDGDVKGRTSGGSIQLDSCTGSASLETAGGSLNLGKLGGSVDAHTSGGSIEVEELAGVFKLRTAGGSIRLGVLGDLKGDSEAETAGGSISATVTRSASFDLSASASGGRVKVDLPVVRSETHSKRRWDGKVNEGGPTLKLHTSGGSVRVAAR